MLQYASIGRNISIANKYFKLFFKNALKKYGLNTAEAMALLMLYGQSQQVSDELLRAIHQDLPGKTQDQLVEELHYDKSVMTRTMQALESKGYVLREANPLDNRSYLFTLTEKAQAFKPQLIAILRQWTTGLLEQVENPEVVKQAMEQMAENARAMATSTNNRK